jgi:hypothetical protein
VAQIPLDPLPVVDLIDLLALKAKSARSRDEADFLTLYQERGLSERDILLVKQKIEDPVLRVMVDRWHARALEEIERERLRRPPRDRLRAGFEAVLRSEGGGQKALF